MIEWQEKWNWDFLKLNPAACYHVLDWGAEYQFFDDSSQEPKLLHPAVVVPADVSKIGHLDVTKGALGDQLRVIRNLRTHFGPDLPIFETVFSPMEIAHRLMTGREDLTALRKNAPHEFQKLLKTITEVFQEFCLACLDAGASGIFYATKWASSDLMTWEDYSRLVRGHDLSILRSIKNKNGSIILHVCGARTYLDRMLDYPSDILSYDFFAAGVPAPKQLLEKSRRYVLGGIDPDRLISDLASVISDCLQYQTLERWYAGPSCVILPPTPDAAIRALKEQLWPVL